MKSNLGYALRGALGSESINVREFVQSAFGQLKPLYYSYLQKLPASDSDKEYRTGSSKPLNSDPSPENFLQEDRNSESSVNTLDPEKEISSPVICVDDATGESSDNMLVPVKEGDSSAICVDDFKGNASLLDKKPNETMPSDEFFWKTFADSIDQSILKKFGISLPEIKLWEGFDLLNKMSMQSQKIAEEEYIQSGLATPVVTPETKDEDNTSNLGSLNAALSSILDIRKASWDVLNQTEAILGAMMVLAANISQQRNDSISVVENGSDGILTETEDATGRSLDKMRNIAVEVLSSDTSKEDERRKIFSSAESAMEAWAMLATSLGQNSFIKSEFEKICFLDNISTDTQACVT